MHQLPFQPDFGPASDAVTALFDRATAAGRKFTDKGSAQRIPLLVQSWGSSVERILAAAETQLPLRGKRFCEWGCGMGAVACLASRQGWEATGFDLEPDIIDEARALAAELGCDVTFSVGDYFVPDPDGVDPFDCDVIFVYAWPAEVRRILELFAQKAPQDVIMLLFEGAHTVRAFRMNADPMASSGARHQT